MEQEQALNLDIHGRIPQDRKSAGLMLSMENVLILIDYFFFSYKQVTRLGATIVNYYPLIFVGDYLPRADNLRLRRFNLQHLDPEPATNDDPDRLLGSTASARAKQSIRTVIVGRA